MLGWVSAASLTAHRIVWSFLVASLLCLAVGSLRTRFWKRHDRRTLAIHAAAAVMIAINWMAFLAAVNSDRVLQSALGYYINPLVNVLFGVIFLHERLRTQQSVAVGLAAIGVGIMATAGQGMPWLSLAMAFSFAFYALLKKKATMNPAVGLAMETGILFPVAASYLIWFSPSAAAGYSALSWLLLVLGGVLTLCPLVLFAYAAPRVPLSMLGIVQYVGPTLQWILGAFVLEEAVSKTELFGFAFVWAGVIVFMRSSLRSNRSGN